MADMVASTEISLPNEPSGTMSHWWVPYLCWMIILLLLISVPGNLLTVMACIKFRELRSPAHLLIINQSVGDLISAVMAINYTVPFLYEMALSKAFCLFSQAGLFIGLETSVMNLMAISVDRFIAVVFTFQYFTWVTNRSVNIAICILWAIITFVNLLPAMGWNTWRIGVPCQSPYVLPSQFFSIFFMFPVVIALLLTAVGNVAIGFIALQKSKKVGDIKDETKALLAKTQLKVTRMLLRVIGIFYACWMPYIVMNSILRSAPSSWKKNGVPEVVEFFFSFSQCILVFSAVINPFIYAYKDKEFRRAYYKLMGIRTASVDPQSETTRTKQTAVDP